MNLKTNLKALTVSKGQIGLQSQSKLMRPPAVGQDQLGLLLRFRPEGILVCRHPYFKLPFLKDSKWKEKK
jgi:hypothetical protein